MTLDFEVFKCKLILLKYYCVVSSNYCNPNFDVLTRTISSAKSRARS